MIDDRLFTSGFLPRDLGLGETVGFALDASVGALSECLVGGFQDPAGWYWIQNSQVIRNVPRANRVGQLSGSQSLLVVISSSPTNFFISLYPSSFFSRDALLTFRDHDSAVFRRVLNETHAAHSRNCDENNNDNDIASKNRACGNVKRDESDDRVMRVTTCT